MRRNLPRIYMFPRPQAVLSVLFSVASLQRFLMHLRIRRTRSGIAAALLMLCCRWTPVAAQTPGWIWMSGSSTVPCDTVNGITTCEQAGDYGMLGIPAVANVPGSREGAAGWTDDNGILWLFGGGELTADGASFAYFNDLWGTFQIPQTFLERESSLPDGPIRAATSGFLVEWASILSAEVGI